MSALVPLVGEVFGLLAYAIARRYASEKTLLDYDEYIHFDTQNLERLQQQAREDIDLVPVTDALKMDASKRKHSITQLMTTPLENTEEYLHLGLEHEDSETVHYAATVRNTLFDRYDVTLKQKIAQIDPERKETLYEVIETCESFMESGLLDDELRLQIQRQASMYLEQLGNLDSTDSRLFDDDRPVSHFGVDTQTSGNGWPKHSFGKNRQSRRLYLSHRVSHDKRRLDEVTPHP